MNMRGIPRIAAVSALLLFPAAVLAQPPRVELDHLVSFTDDGRFCSQANDLVAVLDAPANVALAMAVIQPELETFRAPPSGLDRDEGLRQMVAEVGGATIFVLSGSDPHWGFFRAPVSGCFVVAVRDATVDIYTVRIAK